MLFKEYHMVLNNFVSIKYVPVRKVFPRNVTCSSAKIITQPPLLCRRRTTQGTSLKLNGRPCYPNSSLLVNKQFALSCIMNHRCHQQLFSDRMMLKQNGRTTGLLYLMLCSCRRLRTVLGLIDEWYEQTHLLSWNAFYFIIHFFVSYHLSIFK